MDLLGKTVTDRVTGFKGTVTGYVRYLTGCNQALVVPKAGEDGSLKESHWMDEQRLVVDEGTQTLTLDNGSSPGFDKAPPRR